jgi:hypothetical protein
MIKLLNYTEMSSLIGYYERLSYLIKNGQVFDKTFGGLRGLNQQFYKSREWKRIRNLVVTRDNGCDLGVSGMEIFGTVYVHHMNPITPMTLTQNPELALDPEYLITVSHETHQRIHYADASVLFREATERTSGDTDLW